MDTRIFKITTKTLALVFISFTFQSLAQQKKETIQQLTITIDSLKKVIEKQNSELLLLNKKIEKQDFITKEMQDQVASYELKVNQQRREINKLNKALNPAYQDPDSINTTEFNVSSDKTIPYTNINTQYKENIRKRVQEADLNAIKSKTDQIIYLKLEVDDNGNIISATNIPERTTTLDNKLIKKVIQTIETQVKYEKRENILIEIVYMTVKIDAYS
jgi:predicted RNase H-like nuclease (RuvC/YqgF family)